MKRKMSDKKLIQVLVPEGDLNIINRASEICSMSRSNFVRRLIVLESRRLIQELESKNGTTG